MPRHFTYQCPEAGNWNTATSKSHKRKKSGKLATNSPETQLSSKKGKDNSPHLTVFIEGIGFDVAKEALRHPIAFNKRFVEAFGVAGEMKLVKGFSSSDVHVSATKDMASPGDYAGICS